MQIHQGWGMTETSPVGSVSKVPSDLESAPSDAQFAYRAKAGLPLPFVEIRARCDDGQLAAWDGTTMGELEVRGPWVARAYYKSPESPIDSPTTAGSAPATSCPSTRAAA